MIRKFIVENSKLRFFFLSTQELKNLSPQKLNFVEL